MSRAHLSASNFLKRPLSIALSTVFCLSAYAQEGGGLEEILVTSQKRTQTIREVPISLVAVDGEKIEQAGIENLEDLTMLAPNIHFTETGLSTQMRIRGIGSDNSQGFEQSVGVYKDGIYHGRALLFRAPMFDLERVEILRGPQSTLFGKNSIGGAIDIITAKPTDELKGRITGTYETEFGTRELSGFASGPLNEQLKGRIAVRYYDDPGYMVNTTKNRDEAQQTEKALRATLDWSPADNLKLLFTAEHDTFDVDGRFVEITLDEGVVNPNDPQSGSTYGQTLAFLEANNIIPAINQFESQQDYRRQANAPENSNNQIDSQTLRIDYDTPAFTVTSITGHLSYDYTENCDCDFTPINFFDLDLAEDYRQFSQEIRLVSADDEQFSWLAGMFYQDFEQTFRDTFNVPANSILVPVLQAQNPSFPDAFAGTGIDRIFEQKSETGALFAEATWHLRDRLHITAGARYTKETKEATKVLNLIDITQNNAILPNPTIAGVYLLVFNTETEQAYLPGDNGPVPVGHNLSGKRDEEVFTPALTLAYDINGDITTYAKVSKGYKAGGFDPRSNVKARPSTDPNNPGPVSAFEFEEEEVIAYEVGSKMRLAGGRVELNAALFDMDYDNLQISQFDGKIGFNVGNAKSTVVRGLELDGRWQITDHFTSAFGFAYLDFEYKDFSNGNCYFGQSEDPAVVLCDYTGKRGVYTPEYTINASLAYDRPLTGNLSFYSAVDAQWVDEQQVHVNLDPAGEIDAYTLMALRFALKSEHWELALLAKNLLNEDIVTYSGNVPLSEVISKSRTFYSFSQRPRTVAIEATYRF